MNKDFREKKQKIKWLSYDELAWTEPIITSPEDYAGECEFYVNLIQENSRIETKSLLHLGCGAGGYDYTFKKHFKVTGVDISERMLDIARKTNPEVEYLKGDMRSLDLNKSFAAVVIPDSIDYMLSPAELKSAIAVAARHLKPGGVIIITAKTKEEFRENNFCYTGSKDKVEITIFENNYISEKTPSGYEATLVYLIRNKGELSVYSDNHKLGLFSQKRWFSIFKNEGLRVKRKRLEGIYEPFIMGDGQYPMSIFIGLKDV